MANPNRDVRLRVYTAASTALTGGGGTVDFTLDLTDLTDVPELPGPSIRITEGRAETNRWTFHVKDVTGSITSNLGDSSGRYQHLGRIVEVQTNDDSAGWTTQGAGRMVGLAEDDGPGEYTVQVGDEGWLLRNTTLFEDDDTTNTTLLVPAGVKAPWRGRTFLADIGDASEVFQIARIGTDANFVGIELTLPGVMSISDTVLSWAESDVVDDADPLRTDGSGNFEHLRLNLDGTDYEIVVIGPDRTREADIVGGMRTARESGASLVCWIYAPSLSGDTFEGYLHAPTAGASKGTPIHVGIDDASHEWGASGGGVTPGELLETTFDAVGLRYSSTAITTLKNRHPEHIYPRVVGPVKALEFLRKWVLQAFQIALVTNSDGELAPVSMRHLQDTQPSTLTTLSESNLQEWAVWDQSARDVVNRIVFQWTDMRPAFQIAGELLSKTSRWIVAADDWGGDGFAPEEHETVKTHDNISTLGPKTLTVPVHGFVPAGEVDRTLTDFEEGAEPARLESAIHVIRDEIFDRFGDGPVRGTLRGNESVSGVSAGDFVVLDSSLNLPVPQSNDRASDRIVQITRRDNLLAGYRFEYIDAGPKSNPLATPTISAARSTGTPKHSIDVTLSSLSTDADGAQIQLATSSAFGSVIANSTSLGSTGTHAFSRLPSGTTFYARARARGIGRIRSAWSTLSSTDTEALTAPASSDLSVSVDGTEVTGTWTVGESSYRNEVLLSGTRKALLPAGSVRHVMRGLDSTTTYSPGFEVRHIDRFGGASSKASKAFTTGPKSTAPRPAGLDVVPAARDVKGVRGFTVARVYPFAADTAYPLTIERADDSSGSPDSTGATEIATLGGERTRYDDPRALDGNTYWYRLKHTRTGYTDSTETDWRRVVLTDMDRVPEDDPRQAVLPEVRASISGLTLTVKVHDPQSRHTAAEYSKDGGNSWASAWTSETQSADRETTTYTLDFTPSNITDGAVRWRVDAYDAGGTKQTPLRQGAEPIHPVGTGTAGENLLENGGAEDGFTAWSTFSDEFEIDESIKRFGDRSFKADHSTASTISVIDQTPTSAAADGSVFEMHGWVASGAMSSSDGSGAWFALKAVSSSASLTVLDRVGDFPSVEDDQSKFCGIEADGSTHAWEFVRVLTELNGQSDIKAFVELGAGGVNQDGIAYFDGVSLVRRYDLKHIPNSSEFGKVNIGALSSSGDIDFSSTGGFLNKTLANIGDRWGTLIARSSSDSVTLDNIVLNLSSAGKLSGSGVGFDLTNVPDSTTWGKVKLTALSSGTVDLGSTGVINKNLDNIADSTTWGRVKVSKLSSGVPRRGTGNFAIEEGGTAFGVNRHNDSARVADGSTVAYGTNFQNAPALAFTPQNARFHVASGSTDQYIDIKAQAPSPSGFTMRAKVITDQGSQTNITDGWSTGQDSTAPEEGEVTLSSDGAAVFSNLEDANSETTTYTAFYDVDTTSLLTPSSVTVNLYYHNGTSFVLGDSQEYSDGVSHTDESLSFTAGLAANRDLKLEVDLEGGGTFSVTGHGENSTAGEDGVQYTKVSGSSEHSMTPGTVDDTKFLYRALEAP